MPTVPKTSVAKVVAAARRIVERNGLQALSMQAVAKAVRVQTPSLYKRVPDRAWLIRAVTREAMAEAKQMLVAAASTGSPVDDIQTMATAWRTYAHRFPHLYALFLASEVKLDTKEYASMAEPLLARAKEIVGKDEALPFARLLTAFTHGFISMELSGAFHLGGSVDDAFAYGLERILRGAGGKASRRPSRTSRRT
jgi:AcrR family transcriptional regulator